MLGVTLGSDLSWNDQITPADKAAVCKLGFRFKSKHYFIANQLITLYKGRIHSCFESVEGTSKYSLATMGAI